MDAQLELLCEQLDAEVYSGDKLLRGENLDAFVNYVMRWEKTVKERIAESIMADDEQEEN